ncbi:hypothetical protein BDZ91DRAFT_735773 [Kalaharituber pfeilii]|nr:hypothetical protein BDZ91DRAFT_735773 [Kalaharituber pfeilii]
MSTADPEAGLRCDLEEDQELQPEHELLLDALRRQYLQLLTPTEIDLSIIPEKLLHSQRFQQRLYKDVFEPCRYKYAPQERYTARVIKRIICAIEEAAFREGYGCPEIDDQLIDFYATLLSKTPSASSITTPPDSRTHVTYTITALATITCASAKSAKHCPVQEVLTILESRSVISGSGHTGSRTWEAALALGELLISSQHKRHSPDSALSKPRCPLDVDFELRGNTVLELGAGTGFISVLCAKLGANRVIATDGDWRVCDALWENVELNEVEEVVRVRRLFWGSGVMEVAEDLEGEGAGDELGNGVGAERIDLILGADVTYDTTAIPSLVLELHTQLTRRSRPSTSSSETSPSTSMLPNSQPHALIAATIRNEDTFSVFISELENRNLKYTIHHLIPNKPPILYYPTGTEIWLVHITASPPPSSISPSPSVGSNVRQVV